MITIVTVLILLVCLILTFFVLIQNPKGGGLTGSFGTLGSQVMGVKQSTDVMEKGTWTTMSIIAGLCILCVAFYPKPPKENNTVAPKSTQSAPAKAPAK